MNVTLIFCLTLNSYLCVAIEKTTHEKGIQACLSGEMYRTIDGFRYRSNGVRCEDSDMTNMNAIGFMMAQ
jgi:hypothetical protein